jgi:hypothetical protein
MKKALWIIALGWVAAGGLISSSQAVQAAPKKVYKDILKVRLSGSMLVKPYENGVLKATYNPGSSTVIGVNYCLKSDDCYAYTLAELKAGFSPIPGPGKSYLTIRSPRFDEDVSSPVLIDFKSVDGRRRLHVIATRGNGSVPYTIEVDEKDGRKKFDQLGIVVSSTLVSGVKRIVLKLAGTVVSSIDPDDLESSR